LPFLQTHVFKTLSLLNHLPSTFSNI